tara:strand:+ start:417 stop:554 length:138 start_codon:yes stop_codon:yes gene_type:complete
LDLLLDLIKLSAEAHLERGGAEVVGSGLKGSGLDGHVMLLVIVKV